MDSRGDEPIMNQKLLHELFEYYSGALYWKVAPSIRVKVGNIAGTLTSNGYWRVKINRKMYLNHRLIFLMHHGFLSKFIDHIDNNPTNNQIVNLREATIQQNSHNAKLKITNKSGIKGVSWCKRDKKWIVQIQINSKKKRIGGFDNLELADLVAQEARNKYHKGFARHA